MAKMKDIKAYIADIERQIKPLIDNKILQKALVTNAFKVVVYVDSLDWKDYGADSIIKKCTEHKNLGKGSIILMHNGAKFTPEALERVIVGLKDKGFELVPISQLIHRGEFTIDHTGRQHKK